MRGWIATGPNGKTYHFSEIDGWVVNQVVGPFENKPCTHTLAERETACADGMCPLCLAAGAATPACKQSTCP